MTIRITGYDIVSLNHERASNAKHINGVAHLEVDRRAVDMPFEGTKLPDQLGFNEFYFKDPDETRNSEIYSRVGDIKDRLTEQLLSREVEAGEFQVDIDV